MKRLFKILRNTVISLAVIYAALFIFLKVVHYPDPIATIKLGLAPASKTPTLLPWHVIDPASKPIAIPVASEKMPAEIMYQGTSLAFNQFLKQTDSNAFLVFRNGVMTYEWYKEGVTQSTQLPSYSVAKTMTSIMIGQLVAQGKIKESDKFVTYFPDLKAGTSFDLVTIKQLLDMQAGVGVSDNYPSGPSGWGVAIAQMYATTDMNFFLDNNRKMREEPGTYPEYRSVNTQMLGLIIQEVTGNTLADEFSNRIWKRIRADYDATWNVDKVGGHEKAFCCFNATARDYARVGQAVMSGSPDIASPSWTQRLSTPIVKLDYGWGYGAQMWHPYEGVNLMMGLHGQYIYQSKAWNTVIVKLSDMPTSSDGISDDIADVLRQISEKN